MVVAAVPLSAGQIFLLDFDTYEGAVADSHTYTPTERDQITAEMDAHFAPLGMSVTQTAPVGQPFSTVFFNTAAASTSDGIDLGNRNPSDNAQVNAVTMLGVVDIVPPNITSEMIVRASVNVGMHEALHLLGARHQDAFALLGAGVPTSAVAAKYIPSYPGFAMADLTERSFMSLTTLLGVTEEKLLADDLIIGTRSVIKAMMGDHVTVTQRLPGNQLPEDAQPVSVDTYEIPNTIPPGYEFPFFPGEDASTLVLTAGVAWIEGSIGPGDAPTLKNYFVLPVIGGRPYSIETYSEILDYRTPFSPFDTSVAALRELPGGGFGTLAYYTGSSSNSDGFEGSDSTITDLPVPPVLTSMLVDVLPENGDLAGDYELLVYSILVEKLPELTIERSGDDVVLSWPTTSDGFELEAKTDLGPGPWTRVPDAPVVDASFYRVTLPIIPDRRFFRLAKP
ncbi:hypothetical protein HAHE_14390 [Haloferula helveola]|uniref:Peptidase M10 metallopeptidase domain-containing protein n=2 Tax=Haloferula helveola TaxID=490095 RepID=A0ABN6H1S2_9BACT|nr:hypothetical protein HAHE_14390 [Haloferula helveola]